MLSKKKGREGSQPGKKGSLHVYQKIKNIVGPAWGKEYYLIKGKGADRSMNDIKLRKKKG